MNIFFRLILSAFLYFICLYNVFKINDDDMPLISYIAMSIGMSLVGMIFYYGGKLTFYLSTDGKRKLTFFEVLVLPFIPIILIGLPFSGADFINNTIVFCGIALTVLLYDKDYKISRYFWEKRVKDFVKYPDSGIVDARIVEKKRLEFYGYCLLLPAGICLLSKFHGY